MKRKYVWHAVLIIYILFIFSNSLTPADLSSQNSGFVLRLVHGILSAAGVRALWLTEHVIRKCAHFTEYLGLGILLWQSMAHLPCGENLKGRLHLGAVFFIPFVDETLQLFTDGRSGQISDVWLDMCGVLCGTLFMYLFTAKIKRTGSKNIG